MAKYTLSDLQKLEGSVITNSPSPAGNWLHPRLAGIRKGSAEIDVIIRQEMCNPFGNIHGGMMSLVVDEAIGWAVISLEAPQHYTSVSLNLDFLYAAASGETISAVATIIRQGKKVINCEVSVYNEAKVLLCRAHSNLVVTHMQPVG